MDSFPDKTTVRVLGDSIEHVCAGSGSPAIVLVNGSGGPIEGWHKVFGPLAALSRVIAYNRPGIGGSAKPSVPQTGAHMAQSLRALLQAAAIAPPYVLVGHSLGGLVVNLFARLYPAEVAAVVMIEATAPADVAALAAYENGFQRAARRWLDRLLPPDQHAETRHVGATVEEIGRAAPFPAVPLTVITGGKPAMAWATAPQARAARAEHQRQLAALSPAGRQVIAAASGHFPQFSEPQLVVSAIADAVARARAAMAAESRSRSDA